MGYIKTLPLPPPRCRSVPHQLPPASAVCTVSGDTGLRIRSERFIGSLSLVFGNLI